MPRLVYATRRSPLALAQCRAFCAALRAATPGLELVEEQIVTSGDRIQDRPLSEVGGKGLFVKEIEEALLERRADFAVHSIKDVPGALPPGLALTCIPVRADARDVLVSPKHLTLAALPAGARVGTSSLRRLVALKRIRPDVDFVPVRGNVDTRLRKVDAGEYDAIVLARAGLVRLGLEGRATEVLSPAQSLPAVGQGALGIESREADDATRVILSAMHDRTTATCVAAERGVLIALEGDCKTPIAAYAERVEDSAGPGTGKLHLRAFVADPDGSRLREAERTFSWPAAEEDAHRIGLEVGHFLRSA
jgi:hydroxymethylbilane synthase